MSGTTKAVSSTAAAETIPGNYLQNPTVFLIDKRSVSVGPSVDSVAKAIQQQVDGEFNSAWGSAYGNSATITTSGSPRPEQDIVLYVVDQSSFGLGYHTYDPAQSYPFSGEITGSAE